MKNVLTLMEDNAHALFLQKCENIVDELNKSCFDTLNFEKRLCGGLDKMIHNILPSFLVSGASRFLLTVDLDRHPQDRVIENLGSIIHGTKTREKSTIKVANINQNVISVAVNNRTLKIVILPLGLPDELPKTIIFHSVEDYCLVGLKKIGGFQINGNHSKAILINYKYLSGLDTENLYEYMSEPIARYRSKIRDYFKPLWT